MSNDDKWKAFENQVAEIYRLMGYEVEQNVGILGHQIDIILTYTMPGGIRTKTAVECKYVGKGNLQKNSVIENILALDDLVREKKVQNSIIVTTNGFSKDVWDSSLEKNIKLLTFTELQNKVVNFDTYIDRIIYDFENWDEYGDGQRKPVIELFERANLHKYYVHLRCRDAHDTVYDPIDKYIECWLKKEDKNHITLLGDYGTGKSSFLIYLTYILAKSFKTNSSHFPIPLFISLKNYTRIKDIKEMILDILKNDYIIDIHSPLYLQNLIEEGKILLLLDGFDEMESKSNKEIIIKNFEQITKLVTKKSKIILTSRTHYFKTHSHVKDIFNPQSDTELLKMVRGNHRFEIVELLEFDNKQIIEFLSLHTDDYIDMWGKIKSTYNLEDLSKRPILLEMIIRSLPTLMRAEREINSSELYGTYTDIWIQRDDWRSVMNTEEKRIFMEELALNMFLNDIQSVHHTNLNQKVLEHFKKRIVSTEDMDAFDTDTRNCSFLNRDIEGNYKFIHRSFMEFFVAKRLYREISDNKIFYFKEKPLSPEVIDFMCKMNIDKNKLYDVIYLTTNNKFEEVGYMGGNAISILTQMGENFANKDFSNTILRNANFDGKICDNANFSYAQLQNSSFIDASLLYVNFEGAELKNSLIEGIGYVSSISLNIDNKKVAFGTVTGHVYVVDLITFKRINTIKETIYDIIKIKFFDHDQLLGFIDSNKQAFVFDINSFGQCIMKTYINADADFNLDFAEIALLNLDGRIKFIDIHLKSEKIIDLNTEDETYSKISYLDKSNLMIIGSTNRIYALNSEKNEISKNVVLKLDNIDCIDYQTEERLIYILQSTQIPLKDEKYVFNFDYEVLNLEHMESEVFSAGLIGVIARNNNLMFSVDFIEGEVKFKVMELDSKRAIFVWDDVPGNESNKLLQFLKEKFGYDLSEADIRKSPDNKIISIRNYQKIAEIMLEDRKRSVLVKIDDKVYTIPVKKDEKDEDRLILYDRNNKLISIEDLETNSENVLNSKSGKLLSYLRINTGHEKLYRSVNDGKICVLREKLAELTIDEKKGNVTLKMSNGNFYGFKAKMKNNNFVIYDTIIKESYNQSLKMYYEGNEQAHILPLAFIKDGKKIIIADYSGNLILWNWASEPSLSEKGSKNWDRYSDISKSKTMLESRYINQNIFKCDYMNLHNATGLTEEQIQALIRMRATI